MTGLPSRLIGTIRAAAGWLEPGNGECLVCGSPLRGPSSSSARGLCAECAASIPWIRRPVCLRCGRPVYCPDCMRHPVRSFERNRSAVRYDDTMREWLALYKYRGSERLERVLSDMLLPAFDRMTAEVAAELPPDESVPPTRPFARAAAVLNRFLPDRPAAPSRIWDAVTCVPVSRQRLEERGFNQAARLAEAVAAHARVPFIPLLVRTVHGRRQSMKGRADRFRDMRRAIAPDDAGVRRFLREVPRPPSRVLLVDDIYTTGATSDACASAIRAALGGNVRVYVLTWARS